MTRRPTDIFHQGELEAQERYNPGAEWTERSVTAVNRLYKQAIDEDTAFFIEGREFFFIATSDNEGNCDCSFRGAEPDERGIQQPSVFVENANTVVFPDYRGNRMYNSLGNIIVNPHIGMLFINFHTASRLRVNGVAEIVENETAY
ncbi:MAG: pyridoxamine 5'-phosphate oxidase family protein, partial [Chromatiales bacterium]|nr:pyridoxamine 5'-phosphate oxidase family protein [Chromatiales bacterium]